MVVGCDWSATGCRYSVTVALDLDLYNILVEGNDLMCDHSFCHCYAKYFVLICFKRIRALAKISETSAELLFF